jgi:hypothetical protein
MSFSGKDTVDVMLGRTERMDHSGTARKSHGCSQRGWEVVHGEHRDFMEGSISLMEESGLDYEGSDELQKYD